MATIDDYIAQIVSEKETIPELNALTSASRVSIWRLWVYLVAKTAYRLEQLIDLFKTEIDATYVAVPYATAAWYRQKSLLFQKDDVLIYNNTNYTLSYESIDPDKQVIKQCAVIADSGAVVFKIATLENSTLVPVDSVTEAQFLSYIEKIKYPGTEIIVVNKNPDIIRMRARVTFDAEIDPSVLLVELKVAAVSYLTNIVFDGVFHTTSFIDYLQKVKGSVDVTIEFAQGIVNGNILPFDSDGRYYSIAGYMNFESIDNLFTLIPNV